MEPKMQLTPEQFAKIIEAGMTASMLELLAGVEDVPPPAYASGASLGHRYESVLLNISASLATLSTRVEYDMPRRWTNDLMSIAGSLAIIATCLQRIADGVEQAK